MFRNCVVIVPVLSLGLLGCGGKTDSEFKTQEKGKTVAAPEMEHVHGPHDGHLADLGTDHKLMVEIAFEADSRTVAVYVVDHEDTSKAVAIDAKSMTFALHGGSPLTLSADPQPGDEMGKASKFIVSGDAVPASIKSIEDLEGELTVEIDGKTLEADFGHDDEHAE